MTNNPGLISHGDLYCGVCAIDVERREHNQDVSYAEPF